MRLRWNGASLSRVFDDFYVGCAVCSGKWKFYPWKETKGRGRNAVTGRKLSEVRHPVVLEAEEFR